MKTMTARMLILSFCFVATSAYIATASKTEPVAIRQPLAGLPTQIGRWHGQDTAELTSRAIALLGVDDYISRIYTAAGRLASLYVGFYMSQRQGSSIHSPLNCLPGAGWNPSERSRIHIPVTGLHGSRETGDIEVNRIVIEKGGERQLVLYWYQSHGRVISSEYWGKLYMVADAIRFNRTDAALIRIISPIANADAMAAEATAVEFVQALFPLLSGYLPE
jgi:EpsI family protein